MKEETISSITIASIHEKLVSARTRRELAIEVISLYMFNAAAESLAAVFP